MDEKRVKENEKKERVFSVSGNDTTLYNAHKVVISVERISHICMARNTAIFPCEK